MRGKKRGEKAESRSTHGYDAVYADSHAAVSKEQAINFWQRSASIQKMTVVLTHCILQLYTYLQLAICLK